MEKEQLKAQLGNPDVVVLDVRAFTDWVMTKEKIKGAVRENPRARGLEREVPEGQDHRAVLCLNERRHERKSCAQVHGKGLRESLRAQGRLG